MTMLVNLTYIEIAPDKVKEFTAAIYGPEAAAAYKKFKAMRNGYLLQSLEHPEKVISVTVADNADVLETAGKSSEYAQVLQAIKPFLIAAPERESYEIIAEIKAQ